MNLSDGMASKFGVSYQPEDVIFLEYEPGDSFYLIQSGRVKILKVVKDAEKLLDILGPGDIFGEMAILEDAPRSASAVAVDDVKLLLFRKENFDVILQSNPAMALKLLKIFAKRIYDQRRRLMVFTYDDDDARVLDVLLMLAEQQKIDPESTDSVELETTEEQIANWTALKVEDCHKVLERFDKLRRIRVANGKIIIRNISEIQRLAYSKRKR
ncbi:MAG: Crp/Fnr family transcriptional regulator [Spirochaetota bacterium]|jgi:CRP-like cAMP-binding protein|nr:Crp/Fnr family transcriptional regulator [Spirochaetota bacterium]